MLDTYLFELEHHPVKCFPKLDSTRRNPVNERTEFGLHG